MNGPVTVGGVSRVAGTEGETRMYSHDRDCDGRYVGRHVGRHDIVMLPAVFDGPASCEHVSKLGELVENRVWR